MPPKTACPSIMSTFVVQVVAAPNSNAIRFHFPQPNAIEIAIEPSALKGHGQALSEPLRTEREIRDEVARLIRELEQLRESAVERLKSI